MKIGLSLSRCVNDIVNGNVHIDDVYCIITGTRANPKIWSRLLEMYSDTVWYKNTQRSIDVANELYKTGRIVQPRLNGQKPPVSNVIWMEIPSFPDII